MTSIGFFTFRIRLIKFLGKLIFRLGGYVAIEPYIYFTTVRIKIREIEAYEVATRKNRDQRYRWERLKQDIADNGIKRLLHVQYTYCDYRPQLHLIDGTHRLVLLRELYGDDHVIKVKVFLPDPFDKFATYNIQNIYEGKVNPYDMFAHKLEKDE